jgi:RND family efflux transporter MFP subunit
MKHNRPHALANPTSNRDLAGPLVHRIPSRARKQATRFAKLCTFALAASLAAAQTVELVPVASKPVARTVDLPGELAPYLAVSLHAKIGGYVEQVLVDRGSSVKQGDLLVELSAPELKAQIAEAESRVQAAEAERLQAEVQVAATQSTYERLKKASETAGAVAGNELIQAEKQVEAARAAVSAREQARRVAESTVQVQRDLLAYLRINAPFEGVVTERPVHPGALVGPGTGPILVIQQISRLRLVAAVPEEHTGAIATGANVVFRVPAFAGRSFNGKVARVSHAVDSKTRTMAVELDVANRSGELAPGMYASMAWPVRRTQPALMVPRTSVVTTSERTFVVRNRDGRAEWVDVKKGPADGDSIEVIGNLRAGDMIVKRATDEIRQDSLLSGAK